MVKIILSIVAAFSMMATAHADISAPAWACKVNANNASGHEAGLGFAEFVLEAPNASIKCTNLLTGEVIKKSGALVMKGRGAGLGYASFRNLKIRSVIVGIADTDEIYSQTRWGLKAGAAVYKKAGGVLMSTGFPDGIELEVGVYGADADGLSVQVVGTKLMIMTKSQFKRYLVKKAKRKKEMLEGNPNK